MLAPQDVHPYAPEFKLDPYPVYASLRRRPPAIVTLPVGTVVIVSRYNDVMAALRAPALGHLPHPMPTMPLRAVGKMFLQANPPDHGRLRSVVSAAFTPRRMNRLGAQLSAEVIGWVRRYTGAGEVDFVETLAYPLPLGAIGTLLGIDLADALWLSTRSRVLVQIFDPIRAPSAMLDIEMAAADLVDFFNALATSRAAAGDDLVSLLARARAARTIDHEELLATCILLLVAGHETTVNLLSNALHALLRNPDQLSALQPDRQSLGLAVEELIRFDSPVQRAGRVALDDCSAGDLRMRRGQAVLLLIGSANRDESAYEDPTALDLRRSGPRHLGFGFGPHFCMGAPLARLQLHTLLEILVSQRPLIELTGDDRVWRDSYTLRGLERLAVRVT